MSITNLILTQKHLVCPHAKGGLASLAFFLEVLVPDDVIIPGQLSWFMATLLGL